MKQDDIPIHVAEAAIMLGALTLPNEIPSSVLPLAEQKIDGMIEKFFDHDEIGMLIEAAKMEMGHGS